MIGNELTNSRYYSGSWRLHGYPLINLYFLFLLWLITVILTALRLRCGILTIAVCTIQEIYSCL